ncbi:hypothetical protein QJS04_geneDACA016200 [Acorus gramineus]|uniref:RNase H type-1 domain-containing protein n=1 Tax=Acorus gramineus TaxID=55184 RepID=A0AAV9B698_ACOGR|nr:hypothetical protein QJS04_geneDACA016200 [Acorus gramineus]
MAVAWALGRVLILWNALRDLGKIQHLSSKFAKWKVSHVYREGNQVLDALAAWQGNQVANAFTTWQSEIGSIIFRPSQLNSEIGKTKLVVSERLNVIKKWGLFNPLNSSSQDIAAKLKRFICAKTSVKRDDHEKVQQVRDSPPVCKPPGHGHTTIIVIAGVAVVFLDIVLLLLWIRRRRAENAAEEAV